MLTYNFDTKGASTLYDFLYKNIKNDILEGKIKANEKLPSKRTLAEHLKISTITVENAYTQLIVEGYIYSIEKKGYFVCELQNNFLHKIPKKQNIETNILKGDACFVDFKTNTINEENFPFSIWSKLTREVLSEGSSELLTPMPFNGLLRLRYAISEALYRFRGIRVSPEQIVVGAGTEYLYNLIIQFLGRDNIFAIENPGYPKISKIYSSNDVKQEYIPLDNYGLSITELRKSMANIVHISPSHHFPSGIVMPIKRRQEILSWANEVDSRYIIEDDYDSEFRFTGKPIQTLESIDINERVIYVNTFSKSIAPTIRISYMVLPDHLMTKFRDKMGFYSCTVSSFEQYTLASFIEKGYFERHINRMRNFYKVQRDLLLQAIKASSLRERVTILEENAGLHFVLNLKTNLSDEEIVKIALSKGIKISCLSEYYYGKGENLQHKIIINYSNIDKDKIPEAIERLQSLI